MQPRQFTLQPDFRHIRIIGTNPTEIKPSENAKKGDADISFSVSDTGGD